MAAIFLFFFTSAPMYYIFFLLCLRRFIFLLSDGESYLLFKYIWFTYVFSTDKGSFSNFITKAPNMLKNHSPRNCHITIELVFFGKFGFNLRILGSTFRQLVSYLLVRSLLLIPWALRGHFCLMIKILRL